jgi:hypothetical protein
VAFVGAAWTNTPSVEAAPPEVSRDSAWAFIVNGPVYEWDGQPCVVIVKNLKTGEGVTDYVKEDGYFSAVFADLTRKSVVQTGDEMEVTVRNLTGEIIAGPIQKGITREEIHQAFVKLPLNIGEVIPPETVLLQNYPNPFNPETWIPYQIRQPSEVVIRIYNATGRLIRTLNLGQREAGFYLSRSSAAYWNGKSDSNESVSSGLYFYQIKAGDFNATRRMVIVK